MNTSTTARQPIPLVDGPKLAIADWIAFVLLIAGAVNWGLVGALGLDLVASVFGPTTVASRIVYALVGLAGLYALTMPMRLRPQS